MVHQIFLESHISLIPIHDTCIKAAYCLLTAQVSIGGECWSSANGVAAGGCASGTQCGPWLPDGGTWDGSSPWYCLATPKLASGATCDYATKVSKLFLDLTK